MRKLLALAVAVALVSLASVQARAESGSELEISGNVQTVAGWQRNTNNGVLGVSGVLADGLTTLAGVGSNTDQFGFFVDQVEIDLAKSFGENIRIRADLDMSAHNITSAGGVYLEQAYATANIPAGNGVEFLLGRFNSNIGLDGIDRNQLSTISFSSIHRTLLPHNLTGVRLGYDWNESTNIQAYIVNNLADVAPFTSGNSDIPSFGINVTHTWGEEGNKSWIKFNGAGGPEHTTLGDHIKHWSFLADLNGRWAVNDAFSLSAEAVYRQDDRILGTPNSKYIGGQLLGRYAFSDVWDGTLRYSYVWDLNTPLAGIAPNVLYGTVGLGSPANMHTITVASGYNITDAARFTVEAGLDLSRFHSSGTPTGLTLGLAGMFSYNF